MEYSLEMDQIEMMNLSQKIQTARMENVKMSALKETSRQESLFRNVESISMNKKERNMMIMMANRNVVIKSQDLMMVKSRIWS